MLLLSPLFAALRCITVGVVSQALADTYPFWSGFFVVKTGKASAFRSQSVRCQRHFRQVLPYVVRAVLPWLVLALVSLAIITYVPEISLWLPRSYTPSFARCSVCLGIRTAALLLTAGNDVRDRSPSTSPLMYEVRVNPLRQRRAAACASPPTRGRRPGRSLPAEGTGDDPRSAIQTRLGLERWGAPP